MKWKISLVVAVLLIVLGPAPSCMKKYESVEVVDISLCSISSQLLDNSGKEPKNLTADSVNAKAFGFFINQFYKELPSFCNLNPWFNLNFGNMAYASCEAKLQYAYNLVDSILDVSIYCSPQFNSNYADSGDVSNVFKIYSDYHFQDFKSVASIYTNLSGPVKSNLEVQSLILLDQLPSTSGTYHFTIKMVHKSGMETIHEMQPVYLKL